MSKKPIIRLSATQTAEVYLERMVNFFQSGVTAEEALTKTLQALAADIAAQRELTEAALAEVTKYEHPTTSAGILRDKRNRLQRYIDEGVRDASEEAALKAIEKLAPAQKKRLIELADELTKDAANVQALQDSIAGDEANLTRWQERYQERLLRLKELKADFESLQSEGPALIAQIRDAERAEEARKQDEKAQIGEASGENAESMLEGLRAKADEAARQEEAGQLLDDELEGEPSLDEELAARDAANETNDLINMFREKAGK